MTGRDVLRWFFLAFTVLSLAACKVELHSNLTEEESNEMVALLISQNIDAEKGQATKEGVPLMVESSQLADAIQILNENGYPRDTFNDLGTIFQQQGLISSPLEERVRFIYGLSQSISETLSQIDGVITARVHVIVPEKHPLDEKPQSSTASVFLKTRPGVNLEDKIPEIKLLVQNSVEGLAYDDVVVALFETMPARRPSQEAPAIVELMGVRYTSDSAQSVKMIGGGVILVVLLLIIVIIALFVMLRKAKKSTALVADG